MKRFPQILSTLFLWGLLAVGGAGLSCFGAFAFDCANDLDCPNGNFCDFDGTCVLIQTCFADSDCGGGAVCFGDGTCHLIRESEATSIPSEK